MRILTSEQAYFLDKTAIDKFGINGIDLMRNAGKRIAFNIEEILIQYSTPKILILCGKGNNGGDGYATATLLHKKGYSVKIHSTTLAEDIANEALFFHDKCTDLGIPIDYDGNLDESIKADLIVDCILGIGFKGNVRDEIIPLLIWVNDTEAKVVSIDVPSGLNCDTGTVEPIAIKADLTLALGTSKVGMYLREGPEYCGDIIIEDIGFPSLDKLEFPGMKWELNQKKLVRKHFRKPNNILNKHSAGKVLIIAGSKGMTGAAILATYGALRSGAGVTITINPSSLNEIYERTIIEGMTFSVEDNNDGFLGSNHYDIIMDKIAWADSVVLGPGLGRSKSTQELIKKLLIGINKPLILDADGLYPFSNNIEVLAKRDFPLIITPHFGEMARLLGEKEGMIISDFSNTMTRFIKEFDQVCLIKQVPACIMHDNSIRINTTGNPGLATAGTGDVLAGIIASLVSQGINCYDAASIGAYIHGHTSDDLVNHKGYRGQLSSDLVEFLPEIVKSYEKS